MRTARAGWLALGAVAALGCVACGGVTSVGEGGGTRLEAPPAPSAEAPQLVVLVVVDQLASWVFARYLPLLSPDGFLREVVDDGAVHHVDFPYASTLTAPGHAGIVTGAAPSVHGVSANETLRDGRIVRIVDDGEHPILGLGDVYASPAVLRSPTVADVLKEETEGRAKVASVSFKARAAILTAGQAPDAVFFYEASVPGFTSSTYYTGEEGLPAWFRDWSAEHPPDEMLKPWEPFDELKVEDVCELDDQPGEGGVGLDATFPHDARDADAPYSTLRYTGLTNEYLLSLAEETTRALEMGRDDVPDLLVVAVSSTDYVGHAFGAESCEYFDNLWRLDQSLAAFARRLEARGRVSYLVTADHGVARLVERSVADENPAHRLSRAELVTLVEARLDEAFGEGDWVAGYAHPFVHLTSEAREHDDAGVVAADALTGHPGVYAAFETARAQELRVGADPIVSLAAHGVAPDPDADVVVVAAENWVPDVRGHPETGTNHGTAWPYDRRVPVVISGPNVESVVGIEAGDQRQVAPTLSKLLGVPAPRDARARPLTGVLDPSAR